MSKYPGSPLPPYDEMVAAILADPNVGKGTASVVSECYEVSDFKSAFKEENIKSVQEALDWAYEVEGLEREKGLNQRWGDDTDWQLEHYKDWQDKKRPNPKKVSWKTVEWLKLPTKLAWTAHWAYVVDQEYERLRGSGFTLYCIIPEGGELGVYRESDYGTGIAYEHQTDFVEEELCLTSDEMRTYLQALMRNAQTVVGSGYAEYHEDDFDDAVDQYGLAYDIFRNLKFQLIGAPEALEEG